MRIRTLIVDDEYPAREEIRYQLKKYDEIDVVGEAASVSEALTLIGALEYDLVFLDINFPVRTGIDLGKEILNMNCDPIIVYVTAYQEYALQAFKVNALDYLLKPIDSKEFEKTIHRVIKTQKMRAESKGELKNENEEDESIIVENVAFKHKKQSVNKISAELNGKIQLIDLEDIYYAYVENNVVYVKRQSDILSTKYTLSSLEDKLNPMHFFRVSRSHLVNLDKVKQILPFFKGSCYLVMSDTKSSEVPVSRRQAKTLKKIFDF